MRRIGGISLLVICVLMRLWSLKLGTMEGLRTLWAGFKDLCFLSPSFVYPVITRRSMGVIDPLDVQSMVRSLRRCWNSNMGFYKI